ncbi:MAG: phytoene desaturase [Phycisphaerales bacterium]|nr:MAG: phytoene desaturase [Phycisphaerales bacterium]
MKQDPTQASRSVAVVGAGPGGLACAMQLAARGARVRIYEAQPHVGGRTSRLTLAGTSGQYHFDRGPTFFLMPYVLDEVFQAAGLRLADHAELTRLDPMYRLILGRPNQPPLVLDATQDLEEMSRRIGAISPRDGRAFAGFIAENRAKLRAAEPILRRPIRSPADLLRRDALAALPHIRPHLSVHDLLARWFEHPQIRLALGFQSKYLGMSPFDCPSLFTILPFIEYEYGVWHVAGGLNRLTHAMARACRSLGVEILTDAPVQRLTFQGNRCTGVVVGGVHQPHEHVVLNADAPWALRNLLPTEALRRVHGYASTQAIDRKRYSCSTAMLYLGLAGTVHLPHHTIYVSARYRENLQEIATLGTLSEDPSAYVCNPVATDPSMAPAGCSALYVLMPTPNLRTAPGLAHQGQAMQQAMLDQLSGVFGIEDLPRRIECQQLVTPSDWAAMNIHFGATFSLAHNLGQMLHNRPRHRLQGLEGVWMVGSGTHPGSGLPVIFLSSQITSAMLGDRLGLAPAPRPAPGLPTPAVADRVAEGRIVSDTAADAPQPVG